MDEDIKKLDEYKKLFELFEKMKPRENELIKNILSEYGFNTTEKKANEIRLMNLQNDILKSFDLETIEK